MAQTKLTKEMRDILTDHSAHYFLQEIIVKGIKLDPVDVINDLECALKLFIKMTAVSYSTED